MQELNNSTIIMHSFRVLYSSLRYQLDKSFAQHSPCSICRTSLAVGGVVQW